MIDDCMAEVSSPAAHILQLWHKVQLYFLSLSVNTSMVISLGMMWDWRNVCGMIGGNGDRIALVSL